MPICVDAGDQVRQSFLALLGNVSQAIPKVIFKSNARPATSNGDRAFPDQRFQIPSPLTPRGHMGVFKGITMTDIGT